jgi:CheY-like chemotaxis protein
MSGERPSRRILMVDDFQDNREMYAAYLRHAGFVVEEAVTGAEALDKAFAASPDLIIMDIMMPNLNGLETMRITRQNELMEGVAILALSAKKLNERETHELENLCDAYIPKPFGVETFLGTVSQLLHATV